VTNGARRLNIPLHYDSHRFARLAIALALAFAVAACTGSTAPSPEKTATAATAVALTGTVLPAVSPNPLATADQQALDALAIDVNTTFAAALAATKVQATAACVAARQQLPSTEAQASLASSMDELQFASIQKVVNGDVYHPKVYWVNAPPRTWFDGVKVPGSRYSYDNPDNLYRLIPIDGAGGSAYLIHGQRHGKGPSDTTFSLINNANTQGTVAVLSGSDLVVNADGSYTVTVDADAANGRVNHLQSTAQAVQLFVRNNLADWGSETADTLSVERVGGDGGHAAQTEAEVVANSIVSFQQAIAAYCVGALGVKTMTQTVNTLAQPQQSSTLGTLVTQANTFGHFQISDDQALVVTVRLGGAGYFVLPVSNPWMISVAPDRETNSLNQAQSVPDADGLYRYVIAPRDPGVWNWVDTGGLHEGTMFLRWQNLPATTPASGGPGVAVQLVNVTDLAKILPAETHWVTPAERAQQLATRLAGYQRRIATP
jgi:hypothetical protein